MKEQKHHKKSGKSKKSSKKKVRLNQREKVSLIGFIVLIILVVVILSLSNKPESQSQATFQTKIDEPEFVIEGELFFLREATGDTIRKIAIEIAEDDKERAQGLMYRSSMPDSVGMLFIFEEADEQSFWMKDTKLSLDILYADEEGQLVTIYKYTTPYSKSAIPSYEESKYVVEVIGGFTDKHQINRGDKISFRRIEVGN